MIINIGEENYIDQEDIIAILDRKSLKDRESFREVLNKLKLDESRIDEDIKTYIIAEKNGETKLYFSKISSKTLERRNILSVWR